MVIMDESKNGHNLIRKIHPISTYILDVTWTSFSEPNVGT